MKKIQLQPIDKEYSHNNNNNILTNEIVRNNTNSDFVPQFMLDLYNVVADEHGISRKGAPDLGKTINCIFAEESPLKSSRGHFIYRFNVSSVKKHEHLIRVELRVFKTKTKFLRHQGKRFYRTDITFKTNTYTESRATMVSSTGYGWLHFDVTDISKRYFKHKDEFLDIDIAVQPIRKELPTFEFLTSTNTSMRALLILYSDTTLNLDLQDISYPQKLKKPIVPIKHYLSATEKDFFDFLLSAPQHKDRSRRSITSSSPTKSRACRRKNLKINFRNHDEFRNVISPKEVDLHRCAGTCMVHFGKGAVTTETNHARLQKLVVRRLMEKTNKHSLQKRFPCCAPKSLEGLTLLYKKPKTPNIYMVVIEEAVVSECWCA